MQQFCTYGSVRGASGKPASLPRQKAFGDRLPHGRGSVNTCKHAVAILSRAPAAHPETTGSRALENIDSKKTVRVAREQAVYCLFQHPAKAGAMHGIPQGLAKWVTHLD